MTVLPHPSPYSHFYEKRDTFVDLSSNFANRSFARVHFQSHICSWTVIEFGNAMKIVGLALPSAFTDRLVALTRPWSAAEFSIVLRLESMWTLRKSDISLASAPRCCRIVSPRHCLRSMYRWVRRQFHDHVQSCTCTV